MKTGETSANFNLLGYKQSLSIPLFQIFNKAGPHISKVPNKHLGEIFSKVHFLERFSFLISFVISSNVVSEKSNSDILSPINSLIFKTLGLLAYFLRAISTGSDDSNVDLVLLFLEIPRLFTVPS